MAGAEVEEKFEEVIREITGVVLFFVEVVFSRTEGASTAIVLQKPV